MAKGHEGRQDDHKTTKGTEQRGEMEKRIHPCPKDPEKEMWLLLLQKEMLLTCLFYYFLQTYQNGEDHLFIT